ncbi:MAG: hypothetical protein NTX74_05150 [Flavobacterium sp.]|jgi:hypothetical protein|nr:hypothetical protein [Flavobacterium sp.]
MFKQLLSETTQKWSERFFLKIAIASFLIHLAVITLVNLDVIHISKSSNFFVNPIAAIYTPFSFILVYEVYLLLYYLPRSLTTYIHKQYEIILLIIMRRLFKDLANITITPNWYSLKYDLQFTYDIVTALILFFLIYLFYVESRKRVEIVHYSPEQEKGIDTYVKIKRTIAASLVPVVIVLALYSLVNWLAHTIIAVEESDDVFKNINNVFFEQFFTLLVIVDVLLLLVSFFHTDKFHKVIRNSGFIISTILIRLSFTVEGLMNNILVVVAILFGLIILVIHNKFEKKMQLEA